MSEPQPSDFAINEMKKKKKRMDYIISMAKRVGQPMNEMKKRSESAGIVDEDLPRNEMKKKSESILNLVKRVGRPMNEMKKRSEQTITMVKRSGQPMNEMKKKKKRYSDDDEESFSTKADEILTLESELDEALNLLEDVSRLSGEENPLKKRRKRTNEIPNDDQEAEQLVQDLARADVFFIWIFTFKSNVVKFIISKFWRLKPKLYKYIQSNLCELVNLLNLKLGI